jgi:hypothetical protein
MSPEDLQLLVGLAGPVFAESRRIESFTSDNPVNNGNMNDGSAKIKAGLERMQRQVVQAPPTFVPPPQYNYPPPVEQVYLPPPTYFPEPQAAPQSSSDQFEFNFNITEQKNTNELLETISRKLTKLITVVESLKKSDDTIKLSPKSKGI